VHFIEDQAVKKPVDVDPEFFLLSQRPVFVGNDVFDQKAAVFSEDLFENGVDRLLEVIVDKLLRNEITAVRSGEVVFLDVETELVVVDVEDLVLLLDVVVDVLEVLGLHVVVPVRHVEDVGLGLQFGLQRLDHDDQFFDQQEALF
jgi:hypothetical protein